jgi:hypothetical protein
VSDAPKGLRFEVFGEYYDAPPKNARNIGFGFRWRLVGADGEVAVSPEHFTTVEEARSHIAANRGRLKAASRSKVYDVA